MTNYNDAPAPHGLKAHLHHLLPRHALFHVRITIHQLASVPLVHGEFGVRWKFKNTHKVKGKGKAKAAPEPEHDGDGDSFGSADSTEDPQTLQIPSSTASSSMVSTDDVQTQTNTSRAGQTGWLPLKDHSVTWDQPLSAVVQMSIERDTHRLLPHPFKLTVVQRVIAHDPDAPHNPRLGTVEIDLAEYVDSSPATSASKGVVTRRYLLRDSKTNATLRLSIRVEPVGTPPSFTAPPLPNGEILAGVATLLSTHDDVYRTRPRALDLYAPVESAVQSSKSSMKSKDSNSKGPSEIQPFDIRALPRAYGPRPTESLIEALFNPAPVREERLVSPFTRLVTAGSVTSFPSFTTLSKPYPTSFTSSTSSRPSTSASLRSVGISAENGSASSGPVTPPMSVAQSSSGHGSLAPSSRASANGHAPRPSITSSISPSFVSTQGNGTPASSADGRTHHWWKRNRDRSRSRSRARTGPVAVA